jgi:hypothetical protein
VTKIEIYLSERHSKRYEQDEVFTDATEWRWRMRASNGRVVSESGEGYLEPRNLVRGLEIAHPGWVLTLYGDQGWHMAPVDWPYGGEPFPVTVPEGTGDLWAARRKR